MTILFFRYNDETYTEFLESNGVKTFTGTVYYLIQSQIKTSKSFCTKTIFVNGEKHSEQGPAVVMHDRIIDTISDAELLKIDKAPYKQEYYLFGKQKTKKAWQAALSSVTDKVSLKAQINSDFKFNGSFYAKKFEFHGFNNVLLAVRHETEWFILNEGSRAEGKITKKINSIIPKTTPNRIEVSQSDLEAIFVKHFKEAFV